MKLSSKKEQVCSFAVAVTDVVNTPNGCIILGRADDIPESLVREEPYRVYVCSPEGENTTRTKAVASISRDRINCYSAQVMRGRVAVQADVEPPGLSRGLTIQIDVIAMIEADHPDHERSTVKWFGREA